ncbi:MAG: metallophosphoesterase [Candidatus Nanohaloarchaea archaeon]
MRVLLLTDIHGESEKLEKIVSREDYDAILCAGDLSDAGKFDDYEANLEKVLDTLDRQGKLVKAVPGNMDPERQCMEKLIERRMNIHKKIASFDSFDVVGFGGGITPFGTPFEPDEEEIRETINTLKDRMKAETQVAVIHQPPSNTELDIAEGEHVGSQAVRKLIEDNDFDLLLTGHIHESYGIDEIAGTRMINPGPVAEGRYGVAEFDEEIELKLKQL